MADNKQPDPEVEFSDAKALDKKRSSRNVKIAVIAVLTVILLLGALVSVAVYFKMRQKATPTRLVEINLEEGETLTYRVDQDIQIQGGDTQTSTVNAVVGIRVLNKTSEEYWFLMKVNLSYVAGHVNPSGEKTVITTYFLVRLELVSSSQSPASENGTKELFELYGNKTMDKEFIHFMHRILDQLLPALRRDLYEDVDGEKLEELNPEKSSKIPGAVKMHREANTPDKDAVFIKNHFNRSDIVDFTSPIDMDMAYSDRAFINKSNGMVTESHSYLAEQMNFGTSIHTQKGYDVTGLNITISSHVTLIENNDLYFAEAEVIRIHLFKKLVAPSANNVDPPSNSSPMSSSNESAFTQTPGSLIKSRTRRQTAKSLSISHDKRLLTKISETLEHRIELFNEEVIGINISGEAKVWVEKIHNELEIGVLVILKFGGLAVEVLNRTFTWKTGSDPEEPVNESWDKEITRETLVYGITLGVQFKLEFNILIDFSFPSDGSSSFHAIEIKPIGEVVTAITGYAEVWPVRAGARGTGTIVKISLPLKFTYFGAGPSSAKDASLSSVSVCMKLTPHLTALKLEAKLVYGRWKCDSKWVHWYKNLWFYWPKCYWGDWEVYKSFGKWKAIDIEYPLIMKGDRCHNHHVAKPDCPYYFPLSLLYC